jgi:diguanylate cyclase (GGDEF)-like protein
LWQADERLAPVPVGQWRLWIRAGSAVLVVVLVAAVTATLLAERRGIVRVTAETAERSAQLLGVVVDQMVRDADGLADGLQMVLTAATTASPDGLVDDATWAWLAQRMNERPAVRSHHLLDRDGIVRRASLDVLVGQSLADRPQFQVHRDGLALSGRRSATDPFLSPPGGDRELLVSWPLRDADGGFVGVFSVGFAADVVEERLGRLIDPAHDVVALVKDDRLVMAAAGVGGSQRLEPGHWEGWLPLLMAAASSAGDARGAVQRVRLFDAEAHWITTAQPLAMLDGCIVLARNLDHALAGWRRHALAAALGTSLLLAAILASAAALTGLLERQGRALVAATTDALVDPLTRLFNRRMFDAVAELEHSRMRRQRSDLTLALLDIDHFKAVNDRHGHAAGDDVLVAVAVHLKAMIRREDLLARIGGEEFALLLPQLPLAAARRQAERLRQAIELLEIEVDGTVLGVTVSIGIVAVGRGERAIDTARAAADDALYRAKASGRNRVVVADAPQAEQLASA